MAAVAAAIELGNPGFAEGTLRTAHGFDVDIAKALARRMGLRARLVNYPFGRLFLPGSKPFDVALEFVTILPGRARFVDFSVPYYSSTQGVLVANDITGRSPSRACASCRCARNRSRPGSSTCRTSSGRKG